MTIALATGATCLVFGAVVGRRVDGLHFAALGLAAGALNGVVCMSLLTLGDRGARELLPGVLAPSAIFGAMVAIPFTPWLVWLRAASESVERAGWILHTTARSSRSRTRLHALWTRVYRGSPLPRKIRRWKLGPRRVGRYGPCAVPLVRPRSIRTPRSTTKSPRSRRRGLLS